MKKSFQNLLYYPSAILGILVVFLLVATAVYAMVKIPYNEAIRLWRGGEDVWYQNPKFAPPAWINLVSLGWDGRLILGCVLLAAGALPAGYYALAAIFAVLFVGESVASWRRFGRAQRPATYEDDEEEIAE